MLSLHTRVAWCGFRRCSEPPVSPAPLASAVSALALQSYAVVDADTSHQWPSLPPAISHRASAGRVAPAAWRHQGCMQTLLALSKAAGTKACMRPTAFQAVHDGMLPQVSSL